MRALVAGQVKATFSGIVRYFATFPHPQPDQPERQQTAELGAALGGRHQVGRQRIGAFHVVRVRSAVASLLKSHLGSATGTRCSKTCEPGSRSALLQQQEAVLRGFGYESEIPEYWP